MVSKKLTIVNATGLHIRPAGVLCEEAMKFSSKISFRTVNDYEANAKSVLSVLGACVKTGDELELVCEGADEVEALDHLVKVIGDGLGE